MEFVFELGSSEEPKGHALIYFRNAKDRSEVLATYLVVPPVPLNLSRYMPPLLAGNLPTAEAQQVSAMPLPPLPEPMESHAQLWQLAETRGDDLIYGGTLDPDDVQRGLMVATEATQRYLRLYGDHVRRLPPPPAEEAAEPLVEVSDVIYALMSEKQRLSELAKLAGQLRYALEGNDKPLIAETVREMRALGRHVPEKYRIAELIEAAQMPGPRGQRLCQLYIDRCYRLSEEDYASLPDIEDEIRRLQTQP